MNNLNFFFNQDQCIAVVALPNLSWEIFKGMINLMISFSVIFHGMLHFLALMASE